MFVNIKLYEVTQDFDLEKRLCIESRYTFCQYSFLIWQEKYKTSRIKFSFSYFGWF